MNTLQQKIESLIFYKNEPTSFVWIAKQLALSAREIEEELYEMLDYYDDRGIKLVITNDKASLLTSDVSKDIIQKISKSKEERELSKQAMETLSIILYSGEITKAEIDYIRGVNSVYILRNLLIRGLIEKKQNKNDKRSPLYLVTSDTLSFLGVHNINDLAEFEYFRKKINEIKNEVETDSEDSEIINKIENQA
jgi:segregation and condensation protein B